MKDVLIQAVRVSQGMIDRQLEEITDEEALAVPEGGANSINWLAGHILLARTRILKLVGREATMEEPESKLYGRGADGRAIGGDATPLADLRQRLSLTAREMADGLTELPEASLSNPVPDDLFPIPVEVQTLGAIIDFMQFHEAYHVGQIGFVRRTLGKPSLMP